MSIVYRVMVDGVCIATEATRLLAEFKAVSLGHGATRMNGKSIVVDLAPNVSVEPEDRGQ